MRPVVHQTPPARVGLPPSSDSGPWPEHRSEATEFWLWRLVWCRWELNRSRTLPGGNQLRGQWPSDDTHTVIPREPWQCHTSLVGIDARIRSQNHFRVATKIYRQLRLATISDDLPSATMAVQPIRGSTELCSEAELPLSTKLWTLYGLAKWLNSIRSQHDDLLKEK